MSAWPTSLYSVVYLAGGTLIAAVQIAGLVVCLRRWHVGMGARLGAIGFGLLLCSTASQQVFNFVGRLLIGPSAGGSMESFLRVQMVVMSACVLMTAAGYLTLLLALRSALVDSERAQNASPLDRDNWSAFGDENEPL